MTNPKANKELEAKIDWILRQLVADEDNTIPATIVTHRERILALISDRERRTLQYILDNASGGGNWRRIVLVKLAQLNKEEK